MIATETLVDDYGVGYYRCRNAVDEFRATVNDGPLNWIDQSGVWWTVGANDQAQAQPPTATPERNQKEQ